MPINSKSDIIEFLGHHQREIRRFKVNKLGLFGSFVRGEQKEDSDIDLIVEYEQGFNFKFSLL